ncbi:hypothetical protein L228DRAFT_278693 [Xylona heveae TC161]|uniref:Myb-like DNA-binding domain-containing protein n=1 Tax=Xylona heveae (strain CBS 132557 / TC161) TaxID=1328760 RepID=A0A165AJ58_XYLHT|nr:hypothetical protein L228DRAFT_278693 [Xylona heveae TC161]KZF20567.1 hypothetical protein L228DRAFT_278693 [Xylona heveae TC161]
MPPASNEEQFKFLISCIRYSNNGKVDFSEVANECGIVSKGAAAKRYERMMKAHGISPISGAMTSPPSTPSKETGTSTTTKGGSSKKRKLAKCSDLSGEIAADDEECLSSRIKQEPCAFNFNAENHAQVLIKREDAEKELSGFLDRSISHDDNNNGGFISGAALDDPFGVVGGSTGYDGASELATYGGYLHSDSPGYTVGSYNHVGTFEDAGMSFRGGFAGLNMGDESLAQGDQGPEIVGLDAEEHV